MKSITKALSTWSCHRYMHGSYLLAKHIDAVNKFYEDMGPVKSADGKSVRVTRKSLTENLKKAEKVISINMLVNKLMHDIGKEKAQSGVSEEVYEEVLRSPRETNRRHFGLRCARRPCSPHGACGRR